MRRFPWAFGIGLVVALAGCGKQDGASSGGSREVVVYTALDRSFSEPILDEFTRQTGIAVRAQYDTESTKSVGLANRIRAERERPRCDVHWNNEIINTLQLKAEGLYDVCDPPEAKNYPDAWRDPDGMWYGFAARARVIIVNTDLVPDEAFPTSIHDLADPRWKGRTGIAKPLFGTTVSHVACLFASLGDDAAMAYLDSLKANDVQVHGGNKGCATSVANGATAFALTDTDDAIIELESGKPVRIVYPDAAEDGIGTLFLPNTLAIVKNAPHRKEAELLVNYLLSAEVEAKLAACPSAQIPLNRSAEPNPRVKGPSQVKAMQADFAAAAEAFPRAREVVEARFLK
ncbi:MAG: extracellular solute-binding protein [Phycisphaerae bacterium]|nr:extracellular solute-binding protein [Phycisphaerae bacterium]